MYEHVFRRVVYVYVIIFGKSIVAPYLCGSSLWCSASFVDKYSQLKSSDFRVVTGNNNNFKQTEVSLCPKRMGSWTPDMLSTSNNDRRSLAFQRETFAYQILSSVLWHTIISYGQTVQTVVPTCK